MTDELTEAPETAVTPDSLDAIKALARLARDAEQRVAAIQEQLKQWQTVVDNIMTRELPEKMDAIGLRTITVEAQGNQPAFSVSVKTMYTANIAAGWDQERRRKAFEWLETHGHASLIKTDVVTTFSRENRDAVSAFVGQLDREGRSYMVKEAVHPKTFSSWLKEMIEHGETPPLDTIGGYVERQATIKEERE
jgi:hypothetical protein